MFIAVCIPENIALEKEIGFFKASLTTHIIIHLIYYTDSFHLNQLRTVVYSVLYVHCKRTYMLHHNPLKNWFNQRKSVCK